MQSRKNLSPFGITSYLSALLLVLLSGVGTMFAANSGPAPVLIPFTITSLAGNTQKTTGGYGGDGGPGASATLNAPAGIAVDSVGNVYFSDVSSAVIREINAQTGVIQTIAGIKPTGCTGTVCTTTTPYCADGVIAAGNGVGPKIQGLAIDGYGNIYYADGTYQGVWVIYKGGTQVANFIKLVDAPGVTTAGGVLPGYVYHIAGQAVPKTGATTGCTDSTTSGSATAPLQDNVLATVGTFHNPGQIALDPAGNIYVQDVANNVVRVINTQATTQTFFTFPVAPGFIHAILGCTSATIPTWTISCSGISANTFGQPAWYNSLLSGSAGVGLAVDQFSNVYISTGKSTVEYGGLAYVGGTAIANLIALLSGPTAVPLEPGGPFTAVSGDWYEITGNYLSVNPLYGQTPTPAAVPANQSGNMMIRNSSVQFGPTGDLWFMDNHWPNVFREDVNNGTMYRLFTGLNGTALTGTTSAPVYCNLTTLTGPQTSDFFGNGCPVSQAREGTGGTGQMTFDTAGNLIFTDTPNQQIRKVSVGTQFPAVAVGTPVTQTLQVHFDAANLPTMLGGYTPTALFGTTTSFSIAPGSPDFTLPTTTPTTAPYPSPTTCANISTGPTGPANTVIQIDNSLECYVNITFSPVGPGVRKGALQVTTANGSVYYFALTGVGSGAQIAVDGGAQSVVPATGLGNTAGVALNQAGTLYIADPANNRVVVEPAGGGAQTTIGTGLKGPMGVAVDAAGNVYISDTGNNRIVEVQVTGSQIVLGASYGFKSPQGIAVDPFGNVYVADTGNAAVVEIPPAFTKLSASPLLAYPGAQTFVNPVSVATDTVGNVYVADTGNKSGIIKINASGGDLTPLPGTTTLAPPANVLGFGAAVIGSPNGVAVDAAGNLYVSDGTKNLVEEIPAGTGPLAAPFALTFTGLSTPAGLALDSSGNLYLADSGNSRVLLDKRSQVSANLGTVSLYAPSGTAQMNVTNIGNAPLTPATPFAVISGANAADFAETDGCGTTNFSTGVMFPGLHCSFIPSFTPLAGGSRSASISVQGGAATISLIGNGVPPLASLAVTVGTTQTGGLIAGNTATVNVVASQPNGTKATPTGTVTFTYTINGVAGSSAAIPLVAGSASYNMPTLLLGRQYTVTANYSGDGLDSPTVSTPKAFYVQGIPIVVTAANVTYAYGSAVPKITGTVTGLNAADVTAGLTYSFSTTATPSSPVGTYPVTVVFSGSNFQNYGFPTVYTDSTQTTVSSVTETQAPLTFTIQNFTLSYGAPDNSPAPVGRGAWNYSFSGLVNGDTLQTPTFTPVSTSVLNVGTYTVVPTLILSGGVPISNYKLNVTNGTLTVVKELPAITIVPNTVNVLNTTAALTANPLAVTVVPSNTGYFGTPTGTVTLTDVFTSITGTGTGAPVTSTIGPLTLVGGKVSYTYTSVTKGAHAITAVYNGDSNFTTASTSNPTSCLYATTLASNCFNVDISDFTVKSSTSPIQVVPGDLPGGSATVAGQDAAFPEYEPVVLAPILGFTGVVTLTCSSPVSYLTCALSATSGSSTTGLVQVSSLPVTIGTAAVTAYVTVQSPATLPANFTSELRGPNAAKAAWAFIPLAVLIFIPLGIKSRRKLSRILWMLLALAAVSAGTSACGNNSVKFFTPVPAGPQLVNITGTGTSPTDSSALSRTFVITVSIQ